MMTKPQYHRLAARLTRTASRDVKEILRYPPPWLKELVAAASFRIEAAPTAEVIEGGVPPKAFSMTDRKSGEIVIYVMALFERYGGTPGEFRRELHRLVLQELADRAGLDVDLADYP